MKFLVPKYSCLQNPWLVGLTPPNPRSLCPKLNLLNPPPEKKSWVRHRKKLSVWWQSCCIDKHKDNKSRYYDTLNLKEGFNYSGTGVKG